VAGAWRNCSERTGLLWLATSLGGQEAQPWRRSSQETFYRATRAFLGWRGESPVAWLLAIRCSPAGLQGQRRRAATRK
jgi:hypothetical protein